MYIALTFTIIALFFEHFIAGIKNLVKIVGECLELPPAAAHIYSNRGCGGLKKAFAIVIAAVLILSAEISHYDSRRIVIAGSSCMGRMMSAISRCYSEEKGILAQSQLGGTQFGLIALEKGGCDIACVSRKLTESEKERVTAYPIATDVIAVIVHRENGVNGITLRQLADIYSGRITNWAQLGGEDIPIVVIGREAGSGTRTAFEEAVKIEYPVHRQEHSETGILRTAVAMTRGAVGYISFEFVTDDVKALAVDGVIPEEKSVLLGEYPITRDFLLCVKKGEERENISDFLRYALGDRGKAVIKSLNMMPYRKGEGYAA